MKLTKREAWQSTPSICKEIGSFFSIWEFILEASSAIFSVTFPKTAILALDFSSSPCKKTITITILVLDSYKSKDEHDQNNNNKKKTLCQNKKLTYKTLKETSH
jgi:hypothetical protein